MHVVGGHYDGLGYAMLAWDIEHAGFVFVEYL